MKEVVLDTETTGISIKDGHRLVEIGAIELDNLIPTKNYFHCYLNPERKVSEKAFEVHGYSDEFLSKQQSFKEVSEEFLAFIENKKLIIHNAEFDLSHLNNELSILGKGKIENQVIDTLDLARNKFPGASNSLDALCKRFNIDISRRIKHNALLDCELLREVYINLLDAKEPRFNLSSEVQDSMNSTNKEKRYNKTVLKISEVEIKKHKEDKDFFLSGTMIQPFESFINLDCGKNIEDFDEQKLLKNL